MTKDFCRHCICLIDNDGKWWCDELDKAIKEVDSCPETADIKDWEFNPERK